MNKIVLTALGSSLLALAAIAQTATAAEGAGPKTPWYVGAGLGVSYTSIPSSTKNGVNAALANANGAAAVVVDEDKQSTNVQAFVGFKFNPNFAVEGGYAVLGETKMNSDFRNGLIPSSSVGTFNLKYKISAPYVDAVGILPLGEKWSLIGRLGVTYVRSSIDYSGVPTTLIVANSDKSETKIREKFGAGVEYNLTPSATLRAAWERYKAPDPLGDDNLDVDAATLSVLYRF